MIKYHWRISQRLWGISLSNGWTNSRKKYIFIYKGHRNEINDGLQDEMHKQFCVEDEEMVGQLDS